MQIKMDVSKIWIGLLSLIMLAPCALSINALYFYLNNPDHINKGEALIGIGFMGVFSLFLAIPYLLTLTILRKKLHKQFTLISATPFLLMGVIIIYGTYLGIPW